VFNDNGRFLGKWRMFFIRSIVFNELKGFDDEFFASGRN
jgi:hypothetical protein